METSWVPVFGLVIGSLVRKKPGTIVLATRSTSGSGMEASVSSEATMHGRTVAASSIQGILSDLIELICSIFVWCTLNPMLKEKASAMAGRKQLNG